MIKISGFYKSYDSTVAVRDLSFEVHGGQILGLVGPNGAGKTSTLRAIAGIIPATRGRLEVEGHCLRQESLAAKQCLGYIPDDPPLFHDLTVSEHLAFFAAAYRVTHADVKSAALLDQFQLADNRHTMARNLSRGMRQKLAICCAYLHDPQAILFDEPLTGLDPLGIRTLKQSIVARAGAGAGVIVSSHLLAMVEDMCTHVLILEEGTQRFWGPVEELKSQFGASTDGPTLEEIYFRATNMEACVPASSP